MGRKKGGSSKGSGRKPIYHDEYHKLWRRKQLKYDREINAIRKKHGCSFKEAQTIRRKRRIKAGLPTKRPKWTEAE